MKLEVGKKYVLKSGQVVGPMYDDGDGIFACDGLIDKFYPMWKEDGKADFFTNPKNNYPEHDVLGEYVELT
jgi:hypothetical protein